MLVSAHLAHRGSKGRRDAVSQPEKEPSRYKLVVWLASCSWATLCYVKFFGHAVRPVLVCGVRNGTTFLDSETTVGRDKTSSSRRHASPPNTMNSDTMLLAHLDAMADATLADTPKVTENIMVDSSLAAISGFLPMQSVTCSKE